MSKKFTFKTERPTGSYASFFPNHHYIKLNKKHCGSISDKDWSIRFMVYKDEINEDGNPNCDWRWVTLVYKPTSLDDAKRYVNEHFATITETLKLRTED
jgi:hypothetical protein